MLSVLTIEAQGSSKQQQQLLLLLPSLLLLIMPCRARLLRVALQHRTSPLAHPLRTYSTVDRQQQ